MSSDDRLSSADSAAVLALIRSWMVRLGIRSVYELYLLADVPRPTLHRWFAEKVRLPIAGVRRLGRVLAARAGSNDPMTGLESLLKTATTSDRHLRSLAAECRVRRVPYRRAVEAIHAAQLRIVPIDEDGVNNVTFFGEK